jgi:hypothetical protein
LSLSRYDQREGQRQSGHRQSGHRLYGYGFDEDYELLEGDWVSEIWHEDRKLIEQRFTTYQPDSEETATLMSVFAPDT